MIDDDDEPDLREVVDRLGITSSARFQGTHVEDKWEHNAWKVTLRFGKRTLTADFKMGMGNQGEPPIPDVVAAIVRDADCGNYSLDEFCSELGYEEDSRKAEKIWRQCKAMLPKVKKFFGADFAEVAEAASHY